MTLIDALIAGFKALGSVWKRCIGWLAAHPTIAAIAIIVLVLLCVR